MTITTPETGDLLYSEIEEELRESVRALLDKHCDWSAVLARTESGTTSDRQLWSMIARDLGCAGLPVPEEAGGSGVSWREAAVVAEELGRAVAPVPFLGSAGIATALLLELGDTELLSRLASGDAVATVVLPFSTAPGETPVHVEVDGGRLNGSVSTVADAGMADFLLVPTAEGLYAVDAHAGGVKTVECVSLDMTRVVSDITFDGAEGRLISDASGGFHDALTRAQQIGAVLLASEQLGLAERCLELTVEYLKTRRQFSRVLGSYQALKHRAADVWVQITEARAVARYAAECAATSSPDLPVATALAQAVCSDVAQHAAEECLQLHGGIGFTWEHSAHLFLKRAKADSIGLGTSAVHRATLARLLDLPAPTTDPR